MFTVNGTITDWRILGNKKSCKNKSTEITIKKRETMTMSNNFDLFIYITSCVFFILQKIIHIQIKTRATHNDAT